MTLLSLDWFASFWSAPQTAISLVIFLNLAGALALGLIVGYERSYHGRAAGMRTYGLVCMASAALTVVVGYPSHWFGGHVAATVPADPTRVMQGIVTGIGFLGAGVIMKEGFTISGLTTAASIWASSAIGILVGVGFYPAAMLLTLLSAACMMWISRLESWLPTHPAVAVNVSFTPDAPPREAALREALGGCGYDIAPGSIAVSRRDGRAQWQFVAVARDKGRAASIPELARRLETLDGAGNFNLGYTRN